MGKNNSWTGLIVIALIIGGLYLYSQQDEDEDKIVVTTTPSQLQSILTFTPTSRWGTGLEGCENSREARLSDDPSYGGYDNINDCVGECVYITQNIYECEQWSSREGDMDAGDVGEYGFLRSRYHTCGGMESGTEGIQDDFDDYRCLYNPTFVAWATPDTYGFVVPLKTEHFFVARKGYDNYDACRAGLARYVGSTCIVDCKLVDAELQACAKAKSYRADGLRLGDYVAYWGSGACSGDRYNCITTYGILYEDTEEYLIQRLLLLESSVYELAQIIAGLELNSSEQALLINKLNLNIKQQAELIVKLTSNVVEQAVIVSNLELTIQEQAQIVEELTQESQKQAIIINELKLNNEEKAILIELITVSNVEQAELINAMRISISDQAGIINLLDLTIQEDSILISNLDLSNVDMGQLIQELNLNIDDQVELISSLDLTVQEQVEIIDNLKLTVQEQEDLVSRLEIRIVEQEQIISELEEKGMEIPTWLKVLGGIIAGFFVLKILKIF